MSPILVVPLALVALCLVMALVNPHLIEERRRRQERDAAQARARVRRWIHAINADRCTGCEACVEVCPTYVLDLVDHRSQVVRRDACIECRQCAQACPTTALVMHREGDEPPTLRQPDIDPHFQTAVPGQYLIGEVAGKPLVLNAANMGRLVVEHMRATGLRPDRSGAGDSTGDLVDVAIVGSGPGGLSAALACWHHGLSAVVLEKESVVASTVSRYPRGKRFLAEPHGCRNLSFLPIADGSKEELVGRWTALVQRAGIDVRTNTAVDLVRRRGDGLFEVVCSAQTFVARRVVLAIGTRGKPRTLGVPGESLVKVATMLDDPSAHRGQSVLVVGGGDSALEAACALADAGARRVSLSYRGRSFARAKKRNKEALDARVASGVVEVMLGSRVLEITEDSVTIQLADGKLIENNAVYVLIGADAPLQWLEKCGVSCVDRSHWHRSSASDEALAEFGVTGDCPVDVDAALARLLGHAEKPAPAAGPAPDRAQPVLAEICVTDPVDVDAVLARLLGRAAPDRAQPGPAEIVDLGDDERTTVDPAPLAALAGWSSGGAL
jgi:thioredoxin reductase (NADPH)